VTPDVRKVIYRLDIKRIIKSKLVMGIADGMMFADGETVYEAKDLKVGLFARSAESA
jgi:3-hydroxyacyl-[acyl-carrier protein] dehydratase/trans-2-decenoyl-[acyl-carrier protein] isomerase